MSHSKVVRVRVTPLAFAAVFAAVAVIGMIESSARAQDPTTTETSPSAPVPPPPSPAATLASTPAGQPLPAWLKALNIGGGALLWYYQPVRVPGGQNNVDLFFANLLLDGKFGIFGLHIEPRFRDSRLRAFYPGPVWAQEVYASFDLPAHTLIKTGKLYSHFGLFWDNSFYGNVQVYDGLKLDPDYGISVEGAVRPQARTGLRYWAQYFVVDGHTNVSLDGRDTISLPNGHRRNQTILRVEPFYRPSDRFALTGGLSASYLQADLGAAGTRNVYRAAADLAVVVTRWSAWVEYTRQNGQTVTDFPLAAQAATPTSAAVPGQASAHNNYVLAGAQVALGPVTVRYNASTGRYEDLDISEWMHVPGVAYAFNENFVVLGEYVDWHRYAPGGSSIVDRSVDVTLSGHF